MGTEIIGSVVDEEEALGLQKLHLVLGAIGAVGIVVATYLCYYDEKHLSVLNAIPGYNDGEFTTTEISSNYSNRTLS